MSIEVSLDFESPRILVSSTRSNPLLLMGMVRPQQLVTNSSESVNSSVRACSEREKWEGNTEGFCGFWRRVGVFVAKAEKYKLWRGSC